MAFHCNHFIVGSATTAFQTRWSPNPIDLFQNRSLYFYWTGFTLVSAAQFFIGCQTQSIFSGTALELLVSCISLDIQELLCVGFSYRKVKLCLFAYFHNPSLWLQNPIYSLVNCSEKASGI